MKSNPIRLTTTSYALLALLEQLGESTPYEIKQAMEKSLENFWPVPHTTAYEEPARLAAGGYLAVRQEEGGRRRKAYSLTEKGHEALVAWAADHEFSPPQMRDEMMLKIFAGADPAPLLPARVAWHRDKIAELEGYLAAVRGEDEWRPSALTLTAGIAYHRMMVELIEAPQPNSAKAG